METGLTEQMMSTDIGELASALTSAQAEFTPIDKNATNPFFKSKYADLASIIAGIKPVLAKYGLAVTQPMRPNTEAATVETILMHKSGQWIKSCISLKPKANSPQEMGSAITYARRYSLSAILNISTEDDDDGNGATNPKNAGKKPDKVSQDNSKAAREHWCEKHNTEFFKRGNMKSYAHPVKDDAGNTIDWCHEHTTTSPVEQKQASTTLENTEIPGEQEAGAIDWGKISKLATKMGIKGGLSKIADILKVAKCPDYTGTEEAALDKLFEWAQLAGYQGEHWRDM